jgi:hypothetical protein
MTSRKLARSAISWCCNILCRSEGIASLFLSFRAIFWEQQCGSKVSTTSSQRVDALRLLGNARHSLLMFTSCGWFWKLSPPWGAITDFLRYAASDWTQLPMSQVCCPRIIQRV